MQRQRNGQKVPRLRAGVPLQRGRDGILIVRKTVTFMFRMARRKRQALEVPAAVPVAQARAGEGSPAVAVATGRGVITPPVAGAVASGTAAVTGQTQRMLR